MVVASLTNIVFQLVRHQVIEGDGVSLSVLVSGFAFTKLEYFCSNSVWGSSLPGPKRWRRTLLVLYILLFGLLSLVVGPASAVLLIPRIAVRSMHFPKSFNVTLSLALHS